MAFINWHRSTWYSAVKEKTRGVCELFIICIAPGILVENTCMVWIYFASFTLPIICSEISKERNLRDSDYDQHGTFECCNPDGMFTSSVLSLLSLSLCSKVRKSLLNTG